MSEIKLREVSPEEGWSSTRRHGQINVGNKVRVYMPEELVEAMGRNLPEEALTGIVRSITLVAGLGVIYLIEELDGSLMYCGTGFGDKVEVIS